MTTTTANAPAPGPVPFDKLFAQAWAVFRRNWIVALPPVIATVIMFVLIGAVAAVAVVWGIAAYAHHSTSGLVSAVVVGYLAFIAVVVVLSLWGYVAMFGMADAAWTRGTATFADGFAAFRERAGATFLAWIGLFGLAIVALVLALPTLFLSLLAYPVFMMYVMPSVIIGRRGGFEAIGESVRLVLRFFGGSAVTALVLYAISYGISMIAVLPIVPLELAVM
ncbi:MAG TPA: hypothetical protein VHS78_06035, partial [Candidatus Elarobacter sp.]|nr:hypothetical protein [Candidatus Elarobacter sp.]